MPMGSCWIWTSGKKIFQNCYNIPSQRIYNSCNYWFFKKFNYCHPTKLILRLKSTLNDKQRHFFSNFKKLPPVLVCVACRLGLHFFSKKNEAKKTASSKLAHSKFSKSVVYVIWNCVREFWLCSNSAGCYNEPLFLIFYSVDSNILFYFIFNFLRLYFVSV